MLNYWAGQFQVDLKAYSAGSQSRGHINPIALSTLQAVGIDTKELRSKNWDEFAAANAPSMRVVITVCDSAALEVCPIWPGAPVQIHWGYPDPSSTIGDDPVKRTSFELTRQAIAYKMMRLAQLPFDSLSNAQLQHALHTIESI